LDGALASCASNSFIFWRNASLALATASESSPRDRGGAHIAAATQTTNKVFEICISIF